MSEQPAAPVKPSLKAYLIGFVVIGLLFYGCTRLFSSDEFDDEIGAQVACQGWVEDQLKAPSTADFSGETRTSTGTDSWRINGLVDAENSFGGTVRMTYVCTVSLDGETYRGSAVVSQ